MQSKTKGIVIHLLRYRDHSAIVKIYTEKWGLQSYIINGIMNPKAKSNKVAFYQPLNLLNLVVYSKNLDKINRIVETSVDYPYNSFCIDPNKNLIITFLLEFLTKILREKIDNDLLFYFIRESCIFLDHIKKQYENFPIQFMLKASKFLGLNIYSVNLLSRFFPKSRNSNVDLYSTIASFINKDYTEYIKINRQIRNYIFEILINFYSFHIENFGKFRSLSILRELQ